ncbi:hypothetical protein [Streptosporangium sp. KLBMP 9127]|nr:hypothetical protein [Streptosporangium sp. KLBMP 9127]
MLHAPERACGLSYGALDCVEGHAFDVGVWAYAPVTPTQIDGLRAAEGVAFAKLVDEVLQAGVITVALAVGDRLDMAETVHPEQVRGDAYGGVMDAAGRL